MPTLWFWPNVDAGSDGVSKCIRAYREQHNPSNIHFFKSMEPEDFLKLLLHSRGLIGNSSVGIRECTFLGVPVVNIGTRQRGRERGRNVVDCAYDEKEIYEAALRQAAHARYPSGHLYGDGRAGERIADLLATVPLQFDKVSVP
jgi:UDP-N-acetylglucosamine 2-epimerase